MEWYEGFARRPLAEQELLKEFARTTIYDIESVSMIYDSYNKDTEWTKLHLEKGIKRDSVKYMLRNLGVAPDKMNEALQITLSQYNS